MGGSYRWREATGGGSYRWREAVLQVEGARMGGMLCLTIVECSGNIWLIPEVVVMTTIHLLLAYY